MHDERCGAPAETILFARGHIDQGDDRGGTFEPSFVSVGGLQGHHEAWGSAAFASSGSRSARTLRSFPEPIESECLQDHGWNAYLVEEAIRG